MATTPHYATRNTAIIAKFILNIILLYYLGFVYCLVLLVLYKVTKYGFLKFVYKLQPLSTGDYFFADLRNKNSTVIFGIVILEKLDMEMLRRRFNRALEIFPRLSQKLVYRTDNYYWEDRPSKEAYNQLYYDEDLHIKNDEELEKYCEKDMCRYFEIDNYQYEMKLAKYGDDNAILFVKFDHSFSDGLGALSLVVAIEDNYNLDIFPPFKFPTIWDRILLFIALPFSIPLMGWKNLSLIGTKSPLKINPGTQWNGQKNVKISKEFNFKDITKVYKKLGLTFNDLLIAVTSKAISKYCKAHPNADYQKLKQIINLVPCSMRILPEKSQDMTISNETSLNGTALPLISDIKTEAKKIQKSLKNIKDPFNTYALISAGVIIMTFLPLVLFKLFMLTKRNNVDILITNIPGPVRQMTYEGNKILKLIPIPSNGILSYFMGCTTYNGKMIIAAASDKNVELTPKELISNMQEEFDILLAENKTD